MKIKLLGYIFEGVGAVVYQLSDKSIIEKGFVGGMPDEDDTSLINWSNEFPDWESWWGHFIETYKDFWIYFLPVFIHEEVKPFFQNEIKNYPFPGKHLNNPISKWKDILEMEII